MPAALAKMYESLTLQQQEKVYNFIFSFYQQNTQDYDETDEILAAFNDAKVCVPLTWSRDEINERI